MRTAGSVLLIVLLSAPWAPARAELVDDERLARWEEWREEPLDLTAASEEEIADLPGSDARLSAAVVALREAEGLPSDVDRLIGRVGAPNWIAEAWRDLVRFGEPDRPWQTRSDLRSVWWAEEGRGSGFRALATVQSGPLTASAGGRPGDGGIGRGWAEWVHGPARLVVGHLRPRTGDGLLLADGSVRTRTGALRGPRAPQLDGRSATTSFADRAGFGLSTTGERVRGWAACWQEASGSTSVAGAWALTGESIGFGAAAVREQERVRTSAWASRQQHRGPVWWVSWAAGRGGQLAHGGVRWAGPGWRIGAAATRATAPGEAGNDPIGGAALDRPHRSWQIDSVLHQREWSLEVLTRNIERGRPGVLRVTERSRLVWQWRPLASESRGPRFVAALEAGLDEEEPRAGSEANPPAASIRLRTERTTLAGTIGVSWRRAGRPGARQQAVALRWMAGDRFRRNAAVLFARGERSTPWSVSQPGWGTTPLWVAPGGVAAAAGLRTRLREELEFGAWLWWRDGSATGSEAGGGLTFRGRFGGAGANVAR